MKKNVLEGKFKEVEILAFQVGGRGRALNKLLARAGI